MDNVMSQSSPHTCVTIQTNLAVEALLVDDAIAFGIPTIPIDYLRVLRYSTMQLQILYDYQKGKGGGTRRESETLVRTTISSRGRPSFLIAFPRTTSERPLE